MFGDDPFSLGVICGPSDDRQALTLIGIYLLDQDEDVGKGELFFANVANPRGFYVDDQIVYKERFIHKGKVDGFKWFTRRKLRELDDDEAGEVRAIFRHLRDSARGEAIYDTSFEFATKFADFLDDQGIGSKGGRSRLQSEIREFVADATARDRAKGSSGGSSGKGGKDLESFKSQKGGKVDGSGKKGVGRIFTGNGTSSNHGGKGQRKGKGGDRDDKEDSTCCIVM